MARSITMLALCLAGLLLASSTASAAAARPQQRRHLSQAVATSSANAGPGETVVANSAANSQNGQYTRSDVAAKGAGPGTTVSCEQQAKNGQVLSKECGGSSWESAPACKKAASAYKVVYGTGADKRPWGYEDDDKRSCALR